MTAGPRSPVSRSGCPPSASSSRRLDRLRRTFELHGFAGIETRAVEPLEQMLRKGEIDKEVYVLRRLHADADEAETSGSGWACTST